MKNNVILYIYYIVNNDDTEDKGISLYVVS